MDKCAYRVSGAFVWQRVRIRSERWQAARQDTDIVPSYKQTRHVWLLSALPPTVQTPCNHSIALQQTSNRAFAVTRASDAANMLPAPSDHHMRWATTALRTVCRTLGPQLWVDDEVLRALSGPALRNG